MATFRHAAFARLSPKLDRAETEMRSIEAHLAKRGAEARSGDWGALSALALGVHNVYNGIEDVLLGVAKDVDGAVPSGQTMHQDLLDQMSSEIAGVRPAVLDADLYEDLSEAKAFRHLVRHRYGFDLKADKVLENVDRIRKALPAVTAAIVALESALLAAPGDENDGGDGAGGGASGGPR
jgi:uncharacterized protein YutE (UPF0331/DUF86 family)